MLIAWPFGFTFNLPGVLDRARAAGGVRRRRRRRCRTPSRWRPKDQEWLFWGVQQTLIFPLLILSGMLLPLDDAPGWMQAVATVNPLN